MLISCGNHLARAMMLSSTLGVFFRYMVIGSYAGLATVGVFVLWYTQASFLGIDLVVDGNTLVSLSQLRTWGECPTWRNFSAAQFIVAGGRIVTFSNPCDYFSTGKVKAMTLSLFWLQFRCSTP